jgi:transposase
LLRGVAAIPTLEEENVQRPNREREGPVGERTRIVNRIKSTLARLGIRGQTEPTADTRLLDGNWSKRPNSALPEQLAAIGLLAYENV